MVRIVKKPAVRRQEIVAAARQLFLENGYENTSVQDVLTHLGIAKGTLYHYFQSKEELLEAVIQIAVAEAVEQLQRSIQTLPGSALEKIRLLAGTGYVNVENGEEFLKHLHQPGNMGMHTRILATSLLQQAPLFADLIRQGCAEGIFQTEHPLECAEFILAAIQLLTDPGVHSWTPAEMACGRQALPSIIEAQLKAPAGSFQILATDP